MDDRISELDKKVVGLIQGDLPLVERPFAAMAQDSGLSEGELLERIRELKRRGVIRRFGATLRHQEAGFTSNAMVAWLVPEERIQEAGSLMAGFREVTHCYHRRPQADWPYNLYTMLHGSSPRACREIAARMSRISGIERYELLFSEREFKKTSMKYYL